MGYCMGQIIVGLSRCLVGRDAM